MSEYQYYEFLAIDRPLSAAEQAEVRELSTRAAISATSFTNEYSWGSFKGNPMEMMRRYYDAHLYVANWGTRQLMFRLPRTLLSPEVAEEYAVDGSVSVIVTPESVILDLVSEYESDEWYEGAEHWLSAIVGVRSELAAGDLRPLYLAWLSAYGEWDLDEDEYGEGEDEYGDNQYDDELGEVEFGEDEVEPPLPAGLGSLTGPQQALADFLRLDSDLLEAAAQASPELPEVNRDPGALAAHITALPGAEKDRLLMLVAREQAMLAQMELLRGFSGNPDHGRAARPRRTVAELLETAADFRRERHRQAQAAAAAQAALREQQRAAAKQRRLDELAKNPESAWAQVGTLIGTRVPARYDDAVALLVDLRELAVREGQAGEFDRRVTALRSEHQRKPSLIDRFDKARLTS